MNNDCYNIIFIGRSGCGKGTQAKLLQKKLEEKYGAGSVFYIYTGEHLRELTKHPELLTGCLVDVDVMKAGAKAPDFLAIWCWAKEFIHGMRKDNHVILDGSPRTKFEAATIDEALMFYKRQPAFVIWLDVSSKWAYDHMLGRGRTDDTPDKIQNRLSYYETYVTGAVEYYQQESKSKLLKINGEQTIEKVHEDIVKEVGLENDN